jgi:hypothetical protein
MTGLSFDARMELGSTPGVHALIVGISHYANLPPPGAEPTLEQQKYGLGCERLTAAARTGHLIYRWLLETKDRFDLPLVTCRVLLAPTAAESEDAELAVHETDARLMAFLTAAKDWRDDAANHRDNVAFFYFAGHGFQRRRGANQVLVLADIGDGIGGLLKNAVDTNSLVQGMAPCNERLEMARRQVYFYDACRLPPVDGFKFEEQECTKVFDVPTIRQDDRLVIEVRTTLPGMTAWAVPDDQTLFSKALLKCLDGGAAEDSAGPWRVTIDSLARGLPYHLDAVAKAFETDQVVVVDGLGKPLTLGTLKGPPLVDLTIEVSPGADATEAAIVADDFTDKIKFGPPILPNPLNASIRGGKYVVTGDLSGVATHPQIEHVLPPYATWNLRLQAD